MKKFLIVGSSLTAAAAAGSAGAVDVTLGGSINMGVDVGLGKANGNLQMGSAFNEVSLSIKAAHTTDGGLAFGGGFTMGTSDELKFAPYDTNGTAGGGKMLVKATVTGQTNIENQLWAVSGGGAIDSGNVVSVKINSAWRGLDGTQKLHQVPLSSFTSSNLCKIAGRGAANSSYMGYVQRSPGMYDGIARAWTRTAVGPGVTAWSEEKFVYHSGSGYLPAVAFGSVLYVEATATISNKVSTDMVTGKMAWAASRTVRTFSMDYGNVVVKNSAFSPKMTAVARYDDYGTTVAVGKVAMPGYRVELPGGDVVESAAVRLGPFMEVMMASSETKMVVGAACVTGVSSSDTVFFMDNKSKVMTVSDASIFIEGGFGRLTLQSGDYAGGVSAIAGAGDVADIDADGLVVIAQGLGLLGANPYIALDLNAGDPLGSLEVITGGTIDLGGLSASIDVELDNPSDVFGIAAWDLGATYAMGDLSLAFATDSSSDWGLSASMAIAGFGVSTTFGSSSAGDHEKAGITYSVSASTSLNGFGLSIGFDEDLEPSIGVDYDLGGLTLYAGYDADDEGGSIGATLSF
ncbi:hypothetical protein N9W16_00965 [bacterium]|nr:hypothetical protein [bacterium]